MNAQIDLLPPLCVLQGESEKALSVFAFGAVSLCVCVLLFDADAHLELKRTRFGRTLIEGSGCASLGLGIVSYR